MTVEQYMRAVDIDAFQQAARQFTAIILVRRLNPASLPYIGKPCYMPKSIYCKAKTAKCDAFAPESGRMANVAGLVVDPTLPGLARAFPKAEDLANALHAWKKFLQTLGVSGLTREHLYSRLPVERGGFYLVQCDPFQAHYGAVMYCPFTPSDVQQFRLSKLYMSNTFFIHGDYDLYGIIPGQEREQRLLSSGQLLGQAHFSTPLLQPVMQFINHRIGVPMVQHGSQENLGHTDEALDVFWPDGRITGLDGISAVTRLYEKEFGGRKI